MTACAGRTLTYTAFNKPATIAKGSTTLTFTYDPEHQRYQQVAPEGTTLYFNGGGILAEKFTGSGGSWPWNDYLFAGAPRRSDASCRLQHLAQRHLQSFDVRR
ncbi:MAG: hypothetical protein KGL11_11070 [Alphaproteobacteria bacterium]|nr:hypothetical protein [Alphaproteobacteria bacterium]